MSVITLNLFKLNILVKTKIVRLNENPKPNYMQLKRQNFDVRLQTG